MLECVVNISIGDDQAVLDELVRVCGGDLLDVHSDPHHNRSVFTLLGVQAPRDLATAAVERLDLSQHAGVHPRVGVVDVVPFVPLLHATMEDAIEARNAFAHFAASDLGVPVFLYGTERTLPKIRRTAWTSLLPDLGPNSPHPTAGAMCVGARELLVAYNVWLTDNDLELAKSIATQIRGPHLRTLGLQVGERVQVSMNLVEPEILGPMQAFDLVSEHAPVAGAELVGLVPQSVMKSTPAHRWEELDLCAEKTLETS